VLQRYRTLNTARPRVEHLREVFGGSAAQAITADAVRRYQLHPAQAACGGGDDQSGDFRAQSHVSDCHSARAA
jgi:hypothetical protein